MSLRLYDQNIWGNFAPNERIANRNNLIRDIIFDHMPDVCCFQECNPSTSRVGETAIQKLLREHYIEVSINSSGVNFTPVFYNPERLFLLADGYFPFEGLNDIMSKSVTWAAFEEKSSGKRVIIASVHFWWKNDGRGDNLQRIENANVVAALAKRLTDEYKAPFIVSGDLNNGINSSQGCDACNRLKELGLSDIRDIAEQSDSSFTAHDYPVLNGEGEYVDGKEPTKTLDHIFAYGIELLKAEAFRVLLERRALNSSDHCPLLFEFELL